MQGQRGSSFISTLIALALVSLTVTIILAGIGTSAKAVLLLRNRTSAQNVAMQQMETIKAAAWAADGSYDAVSAPSYYVASYVVTTVVTGLQEITVLVSDTVASPQLLLFSLTDYKRQE